MRSLRSPTEFSTGSPNWRTLYLTSNELSSLPTDVFDEIGSSLTIVVDHRNKITSHFTVDVFDGL